jgi:hypothetical protein
MPHRHQVQPGDRPPRAAARSAASSFSVEEMNTRTRRSGVKITSVSAITHRLARSHPATKIIQIKQTPCEPKN